MNRPQPTVFISHGSPMHAVQTNWVSSAWGELGARLGQPRAVLIASAHWDSEWPMLTLSKRPETIHDFGGFPAELYKLRYPASGAPDIAERAMTLLEAAGVPASGNGCRGLDHGAWVPLRYLWPRADVPVVQISVQSRLDAGHHLRVGAALAPLAAEGVQIIGSGHLTHNLHEWIALARPQQLRSMQTEAEPYVEAFRRWIDTTLRAGDRDALAQWLERAPHAARAHPTPEHFLPLPFAFGAAGPQPMVEHLALGTDTRVLAMDAYVFTPAPTS